MNKLLNKLAEYLHTEDVAPHAVGYVKHITGKNKWSHMLLMSDGWVEVYPCGDTKDEPYCLTRRAAEIMIHGTAFELRAVGMWNKR